MRKCLLLFILTTCSQVGFAQFTDDFSDGDFTDNPVWTGDLNRFDTNVTLLHHLSDTINGESYLSIECKVAFNAVWEFDVTLLFDPSTSNYAKVHVFSEDGEVESYKKVVVLHN